jgi:hypothetical protein
MTDDTVAVSTRLGMAHVSVRNPYGGYEFTVPLKLLVFLSWAVLKHYVLETWLGWKIQRAYKRAGILLNK